VCGIAGRVRMGLTSTLVIEAMVRAMEHRGPDETGFYNSNDVQLAMARLAIIGISNGQQPLTNESESVYVVCNGEIYNYRELRVLLQGLGHALRTDSDVEVISHLYEEYGLNFVDYLRGMFSVALWDSEKSRLVLAKDRLGKKPLLYSHLPSGGIQFASEMKALLCALEKREPDISAIDSTLALGYPLAPSTGFKGIYSLPPAHILVWESGQVSIKEYWSLLSEGSNSCSFEEAADLVDATLTKATELRLISERPIGALLSGGSDSSLVTALMSKISDTKVKTFSVGFSENKFDESNHARLVAAHLGTDHHEIIVKPDPELIVSQVSRIADMPFADSSIIPTFLVSQLAKHEVTVALSGDGGDESFGGYLRYRAMPLLSTVNPVLRFAAPIRSGFEFLGEKGDSNLLRRIGRNLRYYPAHSERYFGLMSWLSIDDRDQIWKPEILSELSQHGVESQFRSLWDKSISASLSGTAMRMDTRSYLPGDLNFKVDMASMANSLEIRSPLMDHHVYELASSFPISFHIKGRSSKRLLKEVLSRYVPRELTDRPKMGFGIPRASWLRNELNPLMKDLLLDKSIGSRGWFDSAAIGRYVSQHENGRDTDQILWPLMMIELWARTWLDGS
jgi:asparagine synthase (glutamine-hydrolysing)